MRFSEFLEQSRGKIVREWVAFALTFMPEATVAARRDHIEGMLEAIARDLATSQTPHQQSEKSKGFTDSEPGTDTAANAHGTDRAASGSTPVQMFAEFRALRASVLRLWLADAGSHDHRAMEEVARFNEAIDRVLAESIAQYARDVDRSKDLFLGILGHDLRNPLGAILMAASMILSEEGQDWRYRGVASRILTSGARIDRIIRDLTDLTRSRMGSGIPITRAPMNLEAVCRQTAAEVASVHPACTIDVEATGDLDGTWDGGRLAQVFSNLVGNAKQHGAPGARVKVAARGEADRVVVTVHNLGRPIPPGDLQAIFDPFRQLPGSAADATNLRSMGLGLYIAREIVEAHRGTIDVDSGEDGTTFTVSLPRRAA